MNEKEHKMISSMYPWVTFTLQGENYCITSEFVLQMIMTGSIKTMPKSPNYVLGVMNVRGDIYPIVDLRMLLGLPSLAEEHKAITQGSGEGLELSADKGMIVLIQRNEQRLGLLVDSIAAIESFEGGYVDNNPLRVERDQFLSAIMVSKDGEMFLEISMAALADVSKGIGAETEKK